MRRTLQWRGSASIVSILLLCAATTGCVCTQQPDPNVCSTSLPRELNKVNMPTYVIEPPDILLIDAIRVVPKPPYRIQPLDFLLINAPGALATDPIGGLYLVDPDGTVNLGLSYGSVKVVGMSTQEAREEVEKVLKVKLKQPDVTVSLGQSRGQQQIRGEHLVRPDGTVSLGLYGSVRVTGLTLQEAKAAMEAHLAQFLERPEVAVDILAYNSKVFYVIFQGGLGGQQVVRLPITGNDTVLDAVANLNGLLPTSDENRMWISRPAPACNGCDQVIPVDWNSITKLGRTDTNYQLLPGDRLFVKADPMIMADTRLSRILAPFERVFGFMLLGNGAIRAVGGQNNGSNGGTGF